MSRHINIPIFIPHKGCPNDCIFCNQKKISGQLKVPEPDEMEETIRDCLETVKPDDCCEIAFFGGSFTGLPEKEQRTYLKIAARYVDEGAVNGIRLSTRPDYINRDVLLLLREYPVKVIELGIQSLDEEVLAKSGRGYTPGEAIAACHMVQRSGFFLGAQTMIGLPGDTFKKSLRTARELIKINPAMVRIYPTLVVRGTVLEEEYVNGRYQPLTLEKAVLWCSRLVRLYETAGIHVLRTGLHTENLDRGNDVVAGPVHPAFGELVQSKIWLKRITAILERIVRGKYVTLTIHVCPSEVSMVTGQHRQNLIYLKERYGLKKIRVLGDHEVQKTPRFEFH